MATEWNYLDLFSGISGFAKGIESAGVKIKNHFFSEIDKNAIKIYEKHFPGAKGVGDVSAIRDVSQFGKIDIITFGFPCQDLSLAGKRHGLKGARSGLFFEAIRLVRELQPAYFIFENVKGLLTSDGGKDFIRCLREIADIGIYDCEWQLVNTCWLLPQNRERIYFIGHLRGKSKPKVFPFTDSDGKNSFVSGQISNTLTTRTGTNNTVGSYVVESELSAKTKRNPQGARINSVKGNSVCLSDCSGGQGSATGLYVYKIGKDGKLKNNQNIASCFTAGANSGGNHSDMDLLMFQKSRGNNKGGYKDGKTAPTLTANSFEYNNFIVPVLTPDREKKSQNGRRFKENGDPSFTLTTQDRHGIYDGYAIRRLTPLEYERLQGFPDGWTEGLSDSARYKALGNAVTVNIVTMIIERLISPSLPSQ